MKRIELIKHIENAPPNLFWRGSKIESRDLELGINVEETGQGKLNSSSVSVRKFVRSRVLSNKYYGFCKLRIENSNNFDDDKLIFKHRSLISQLGELMGQNGRGDLFYRVEQTQNGHGLHRLSKGAGRTTLHTDCSYGDDKPKMVALCCIRPASEGGSSLLVSAYSVLQLILDHHIEILDTLFDSFYFDRRGSQIDIECAQAGKYQMIEVNDAQLDVRYKRPYMESGHHISGTAVSDKAVDALDTFDSVINSPKLIYKCLLDRGDILILNNQWLLHDRKPFVDSPNEAGRLLIRNWLR